MTGIILWSVLCTLLCFASYDEGLKHGNKITSFGLPNCVELNRNIQTGVGIWECKGKEDAR
jgi:hypothetical protein